MMDILELVQEKFVPMQDSNEHTGEKVESEQIFFGGDQLTEERARNIQKARADGRTTSKRLDAVWPNNEDWHAIRTGYRVPYQYLHLNTLLCSSDYKILFD